MRLFCLFLLVLLLGACQRHNLAMNREQRLYSELDSLLESVSRPMGGSATACVLRLDDGSVFWEYDSWRRMMPASTQKALVASALRPMLGKETRLRTGLYVRGSVVDSVLEGDLMLLGGGDPSFGKGNYARSLDTLVQALRPAGIRRVRGRLVVRDPLMVPKDGLWPGSWDFDNSLYDCVGAPSTGLSLDGNCPGNVAKTNPHEWIIQEFRLALERDSMTVDGPSLVELGPGIDSTWSLLYNHESAPVDSLLREALLWSSNHTMETLGLLAGQGDSSGGRENGMRRVRAYLQGLGLDTNRNHLQDMSGLSRKNYVTARDMAYALRRVFLDTALDVAPLLPMPGQGTLKNRFLKGFPQEARLYAKTGSLDGTSNMAGLLKPVDGPPLVFVLFFSGHAGVSAPVREAQEKMLLLLANPQGGYNQ